MKKLLLLVACMAVVSIANAQPWMPKGKPGPFKLQDIIDDYAKQPHGDNEERETNGVEKEGKDYLFNRWVWYWKEHLDKNGYMVSPVKTLNEWNAYRQKTTSAKTHAKTTDVVNSNWTEQGPTYSPGGYNGLGRINVVAFHPTDPNTIYAGTAGGGTWKSTDNGITWHALYSTLPTMGVSDIKINPLNPNTIYVCTGDADGGDAYSEGVIKSTDGGATWTNTGLTWAPTDYLNARSMQINPLDTNSLTLATNIGMYKSMDGGATWTNVFSGDFEQVLYNPADTTIMYATDYAGGTAQILHSVDGGNTWITVTSFTDASRINIAVTQANPTIVKALAANMANGLEGIYSSSDNGASYTPLYVDLGCTKNLIGYDLGLPTSACGGQGWYDLCIAIDQTNPNNVIVGGVNNYYSTDGGSSWQIATQWYSGLPGISTVHADKHCLAHNPLNNALYETCDGGIYETLDPQGLLWNDLTNGLGITEFYRNAVANGVPFCIGGAQDNGTKMVNAGVYTDLTGGDGMQCQIDYTSPSLTWYTSFPQGSFDVTNDGGLTYGDLTITSTLGDWITPFIIHPTANNILLAGYDMLYASYDNGSSWAAISPVLDAGYNINNIVVPFTSEMYVYVATDNNVIHFTPDFGVTWTSIFQPFDGNISRIAVDPKNENKLWVTYNGYGTTKVQEYNRTTNTWTAHDGTLPDIPVNCIKIDSFSETKYIGTDVAVYYMDTTMTDWALYDNNLPAVIVNDLNINYATEELWAATYGRGMWKTIKRDTPTAVVIIDTNELVSSISAISNAITLFPDPNHGTFTITSSSLQLRGQKATIQMITADGKVVWHEDAAFDKSGSLKVNASGLAKGTYICKVSNKNTIAECKLLVD